MEENFSRSHSRLVKFLPEGSLLHPGHLILVSKRLEVSCHLGGSR